MFLQTFNFETEYVLKNALFLFRQGYVDVAYFQLRSAIELSMVSVYLLFEYSNQKKLIKKWQKLEIFPTFNKMIEELKKISKEFKMLHKQLPILFEYIKETNKILNKKTHKQGTRDYYRIRNHKNMIRILDNATPTFVDAFIRSFGISLIVKLLIDPMPLLLTDEEIYLRIIGPLAGPIRNQYIEKYKLEQIFDEYKRSDYYKNFQEHFMKLEKHSRAFIEFENFGNFSYDDLEIIINEFESLSSSRKLFATICRNNHDIISMIFDNGFTSFITDKKGFSQKAVFDKYEWIISDFLRLEEPFNEQIENFYRTRFIVNKNVYYLNHSRVFSEEEIVYIRLKIENFLFS